MASESRESVQINGRTVSVEWTRSAGRELARRAHPLIVEMELYFSCLVKKFVHFHEAAPDRRIVHVNDKLSVYFRPVTSTACSFEVADRLGRQPEIELDTPNSRKMAPRLLRIDFVQGQWQGNFWI